MRWIVFVVPFLVHVANAGEFPRRNNPMTQNNYRAECTRLGEELSQFTPGGTIRIKALSLNGGNDPRSAYYSLYLYGVVTLKEQKYNESGLEVLNGTKKVLTGRLASTAPYYLDSQGTVTVFGRSVATSLPINDLNLEIGKTLVSSYHAKATQSSLWVCLAKGYHSWWNWKIVGCLELPTAALGHTEHFKISAAESETVEFEITQ